MGFNSAFKWLSNASLMKITQLQSYSIQGHKGISSRAFQTSRAFWVRFGAGDLHVTPLSKCKFVTKRIAELNGILHLMAQMMFCAYRIHVVRSG